ncbi:MAG: Coenzyme F420 hydrogenase/dehydrogenase, beta subunit C-terminal domain [Clostridia bacterium]|nr:Coenzyme F420 hydrogenase/dehydrogenase, beta subunit C-terminal domain [Clostridia bacterium]
MKHIATLTTHAALNYGAVLQAYALHKYIGDLGCKCEVLNYVPEHVERSYELLSVPKNPKGAALSAFQLINYSKRKLRKERFAAFRKEYLCLSGEKIKTHKKLVEETDRYDLVVCGSDQIWSPVLHGFDEAYFLSFPNVKTRRISYAASFGQDIIDDKHMAEIKRRLAGFSDFACREKSAEKIISELTGKEPYPVLDPVFLIEPSEWLKIAKPVNKKSPFNLAYFLSNPGNSPHVFKKHSEKSGRRVLSIGFSPRDFKYGTDCDYSLGPCEFIDAIASADFVLTNSFHCTAFAILFGKNFYTRISESKNSRNDRMITLLKELGLEDRVYTDSRAEELDFDKKIDYEAVNARLEEKKKASKAYLTDIISNLATEEKFRITEGDCCACGACLCACPKEAIKIEKNENGFYYPYINEESCIRCGKCRTVCPVNNRPKGESWENGEYHALWSNNRIERSEGSSGGAFGLIADDVISQGGVVFGAAYSEDFRSVYQTSTEKVSLKDLKKSKYVESYTGDVFLQVKNELEKGRPVFYCGTSCQIDGLMSFLGKSYTNLITCDFLCHGVPSAGIYTKYIDNLESKYGKIKSIDFRSKAFGWKAYCTKAEFESGKTYLKTLFRDPYLRLFFENNILRDSCYGCKRLDNSNADLTIGDFWRVCDTDIPDTNEGISLVCAHTAKGREVTEKLIASGRCEVHRLEKSSCSYAYNKNLRKPQSRNSGLKKAVGCTDLFEMKISGKKKVKGYLYLARAVLDKVQTK